MTNVQIVAEQSMRLMEAGIIGTTGRTVVVKAIDKDGNEYEREVQEPEAIHTYQVWKSLGFQVKKGSKAVAKFSIWKHVEKKAKSDDEEDSTLMIMKKAAWFSASQVEKIQ